MKSIELRVASGSVRVAWFPGASRDAILEAVRSAAGLPPGSAFHVETAEGAVVALDDSLPDALALVLVVENGRPAAKAAPAPVPGPKGYPIIGNLGDFRRGGSLMDSIAKMQAEYGRFFRLRAPGVQMYFCADADIISEIRNDPESFPKLVEGRSGQADLARKSVGNALFTASDNDPLWDQAHRILMPAFGTSALKNYFGRIRDVADDLFAHLDALAPGQSFMATDIMTRMTFEAISYAAFNKRYNAIDTPDLPPFVQAMNVVLHNAMQAPRRFGPSVLYRKSNAVRAAADKVMAAEVDVIVRDRQVAMQGGAAVPTDLLQIMLTTPDRVTGQKLPAENIRGQLITFLIAGHETTSGLLSYALYHLWKNPEVQAKLIAEADAVLGRDYSYEITYEDCARLDYTQRVLKEALRLTPTIPMFSRTIRRDTRLGQGTYQVHGGDRIFFSLGPLQRDPLYWGEDAETFEPDHFTAEAEQTRHPDAYHPFGMGARACIGFQFALLEAKMVLARFAQRYIARPIDPNYVLHEVQALTVKPDHLEMVLDHRPEIKGRFPERTKAPEKETAPAMTGNRPMVVLYGSNMGGSRDIAIDVARRAGKRGFAATVKELDEQVEKPWLTTGPVVIVTSTYNGTPPDNARRFATYLDHAAPGALHGVRYAVFGCGNKQWRQTFQKFPVHIDAKLKDLGAESFLAIGAADADGDFEAAVESWVASLVSTLETSFAGGQKTNSTVSEDGLRVEIIDLAGGSAGTVSSSKLKLNQDSFLSVVKVNRELQVAGSSGSTRHIEFALPAAITYKAGDHLTVFPENPRDLVEAIAKRCGVMPATTVLLSSAHPDDNGISGLPLGLPISVGDILTQYIDLTGPVTRRELRAWAETAGCPPDKHRLDRWLADFSTAIGEGKPTVLDLLDQAPSVHIDLATILTLRPTLKPRYYSISSSSRVSPDRCSVTVGVQRFTGADGREQHGLCSSYLAGLGEGEAARIMVKDTGTSFRLPDDALIPVVLVGPGTGVAPLRGFIQERAALRARGVAVGRTALFFGCRGTEDHLYREELEAYRQDGTLTLLDVAYSRLPDRPKTYVQDSIRQHAASVLSMIQDGGSIFVCGNARGMAPGVRKAFSDILGGEAEVENLERERRYLQDVWAGG
jgi:cytochrome P450/NADPH-cytochrome P450 reductase